MSGTPRRTLPQAPLSLRTHLILLILAATLPGTVLTAGLVWRTSANNRSVIAHRLVDSARVGAAALDREFEGTIGALEALATSPSIDADDLQAFYQEARRVHLGQRWYTVLLLTPDGRQLVSTRLPWGTPLLSVHEPESLRRLIERRQPVVGRVREMPRGQPGHGFAIRVPVLRGGEVRYALTAILRTDSLDPLVRSQLPAVEEWTRTILDPGGTIAARTREPERFVGRPTTPGGLARLEGHLDEAFREPSEDGEDMYAAMSRGAFGWTTAVFVPPRVLDAPLRGSAAALLIGGMVVMLCGLSAVLVISRRLSRDLGAAARAAEAVAEGRDAPPAQVHVAETGRLHQSLRAAASLLLARQRERDEEVRRAEAARAEAEQANHTKDRFLAMLGHELRNPLAPVVMALELMKRRDPQSFQRERLMIERQVRHMVRLVNDLLDVSRLTTGKVELRPLRFELRQAVDRAVDMARPLISQHEHELRVDVPPAGLPLDADEDRIVQVLANLLTNAAKYTQPGGHILLQARQGGPDQGRVVTIVCEDDGPGVPAELLPTLFSPFAQGPRTIERHQGGLGLGLALSRSLTEMHGGTVRYEPRAPEGGSRFVVELPLAPVVALAPQEDPHPPPQGTPRRVLLVDDNADALEVLRGALEQAGHVVSVAADGPAAIAAAEGFAPEVGVLDIGLPGMSGYELAGRLRQGWPRMRLIALTGYGQPGDVAAAAQAGFDARCVKPVTLSVLLQRIEG